REDRNIRWDVVFQTEHPRIAGDQQQQTVRRDFHVRRESEPGAVEFPRILRVIRVVQPDRTARDVLQLNELLITERWMIPDFIDDDRANPRPRVRTAQGVGNLRGILRLPSADDVAPEAHAVFGRTEAEAVAVTGQIPVRIGGKEINFLAMRIEPEAA